MQAESNGSLLTFPRRSLKCQRSWNLSGHEGCGSTTNDGSEGDHPSPVGTEGHRPAGVFWLLEEEILHKERRDFVRRQNRGVRKICRGRKTKVSRQLFIFHILAEGGDVVDGRIVDVMLELAEA